MFAQPCTQTHAYDALLRMPSAPYVLARVHTCVACCVPHTGGGAALLHLSELVPAFRETLTDEEEKLGCDIVMKALRAPCRIIAENAGVEGEVIVQRLLGKAFELVSG